MRPRCRPALTRIEVAIVLATIALIFALSLSYTLPGLAWMRERSRRNTCVLNLKGMGTGFYTYLISAPEWPIAAPSSRANPTPTPVVYFNMTGRHGGAGRTGDPVSQASGSYWDQLSTTRSMWMLIRQGGCDPRTFICLSTSDTPDTVANPASFWDFAAKPADTSDDRGWDPAANNEQCVSYGYQVPYGEKGLPSADCDQRMALAADKGPYGAVSLNNAGVTDPPTTLNEDSDPNQWSPFNSLNHGGQGQGVLYADSHVEFQPTPIVGVGRDNIYTAWKRPGDVPDRSTRLHGDRPGNMAPFNSLTPAEETDSLIYP
jgi:hypothetical protein